MQAQVSHRVPHADTEKTAIERSEVMAETFARLRLHYSEREICDIVWLVASEHVYNMTNIGLHIGSDGLCKSGTRGGDAPQATSVHDHL